MNRRFGGEDVDAFVLTYNREELISETLEALLAQTASGIRITVLDNGSSDKTSEVVAGFNARGVRYLRSEMNQGWQGNFERAQALAERAWTLLFHDDDLLHPRYIEFALDIVNSESEVAMVASGLEFTRAPVAVWAENSPPKAIRCAEARDLAALMYAGYSLCFSSVLYRTACLKSVYWKAHLYGKIADRPLLLDVACQGPAVVLDSPLVKYRVHSNQDSASPESGPFVGQLAALHRCYRNLLGEGADSYGRCFLVNNYRLIRDEFCHLSVGDRKQYATLSAFLDYMAAHGALSAKSRRYGWVIHQFRSYRMQLQRVARFAVRMVS